MENKRKWGLWLIKTFFVSVVMSFLALFLSALLARLVKGTELHLVGLIGPSLSFSWRLGIISTVAMVILVFFGSMKKSRKRRGEG